MDCFYLDFSTIKIFFFIIDFFFSTGTSKVGVFKIYRGSMLGFSKGFSWD